MGRYIDGFIIPIKKKNVKDYLKMAKVGCKVWMEHGALDYYECIGDELKIPYGLTFPKMCKLKSDETVVFAFIVYKSRAHCMAVNKKVGKDPRMSHDRWPKMPFDDSRFAAGRFKTLVSSTKK